MAKISSYLKPYWKAALAAPLLMMVEVLMDLMQPTLMATVVDQGVMTGDIALILRMGALMIGVALIGALGGIGCTYFSSHASVGFATDLRQDLFEKVQSFSFSNIDEFAPASLITRLTNDVTQVQQLVLAMMRMLVRSPLTFLGGTIMAISINPRLALVILAALPVLSVSLYFILSKAFPLFSVVQTKLDRVNEVMQENLAGVRVIKAFVRAAYEKSRFAKANEDLMQHSIKAGRLMGIMHPIMILVMNCSIAAVLWFGGKHVNANQMQVGQVMAFVTYMNRILFSLTMAAFFLMNISRAKASADRIREVLNTEVDIEDKPGAINEPIKRGRVEFENVSFRYKGASGPPVLKNVSFTVEPGETIAILGSTGSGKSTLVHLIPRFYDVTEGRVTIDGVDVRDMSLATLRGSIGMVLQESLLFTGTIRENIAWGDSQAPDEEIVASATAAQAHSFISSFPEGYDTLVSQGGVNLSGGQKQRLAIARALLKKPKILILDDSTSAVDMGTEARLQAALRERLADTTCFIIAQRISSVLDADRIIVLEDGQIVGNGTHEELIRSCRVYQEIYNSQLGREEAV
ncbi:MAG: ABC transporter ATP-binding protein [Firmicutes bacterium]|jgi:ATP-binding cassette subfamily B protein|nr:ABC transporter ATP-binding protein [Bacillota bacterium]